MLHTFSYHPTFLFEICPSINGCLTMAVFTQHASSGSSTSETAMMPKEHHTNATITHWHVTQEQYITCSFSETIWSRTSHHFVLPSPQPYFLDVHNTLLHLSCQQKCSLDTQEINKSWFAFTQQVTISTKQVQIIM